MVTNEGVQYPWIRFYCLPGRQKAKSGRISGEKSDTDGSLCGNAVWRDALRRREVSSCPRRKTGRNRDGAADPKEADHAGHRCDASVCGDRISKYPQGMHRTGTEYIRLARKETDASWKQEMEDVTEVASVAEAAAFLAKKEGRIFAATGSKELSAYQVIPDYQNRVVARVLSPRRQYRKCAMLGFSGKNLICNAGTVYGRSEMWRCSGRHRLHGW